MDKTSKKVTKDRKRQERGKKITRDVHEKVKINFFFFIYIYKIYHTL